jgi:hypothetical protein
MRNEVIATLLVVAIIAGGGAGFFVGNSGQRTTTSVSTLVSTTTVTQSVQTTSPSCVQTGIHGSLYVRVISDNDTNRPISGANVTVTILNYCGSEYSIPLGYTNDTGYTTSPAGWTGVLQVNVTADVGLRVEANYIFLTETSGAVSLATVSLPSGLTVIKPIACYGAFPAACGNTTTTTTAFPIASG